jgi:hypothetical protein
MKRLLALLALSPLAVVAGLLTACEPGVPPCADIVDGTGYYDGDTVFFRMELGAPPCSDEHRYEVVVKESAGGPRIARGTYRGTTSASFVEFFVTAVDDDPSVCVFARTRDADGDDLDLAPDAGADGCVPFTVDQTPPSGAFQ